jgi:hypothetical protein
MTSSIIETLDKLSAIRIRQLPPLRPARPNDSQSIHYLAQNIQQMMHKYVPNAPTAFKRANCGDLKSIEKQNLIS